MKKIIQNKCSNSLLGDLLLTLRRNIVDSIRKEGLKKDLSFSQVEILRFIGHSGKKTMKSIAEYLKITPPSVTEMIGELEKKGLVKRESDKLDKRIVLIAPTNTAKKLFVSICKRKEAVLKKMTSKLDETDKKNLERIIKIIITE